MKAIKFLFFFSFLLISSSLMSQIVFDKTNHNFGSLFGDEERYVDIYLKNTGSTLAYVLSVRNPMDVVFIQKNALIAPDSSTVLRFQVDKRSTGRFDYKIPVYTSDKNEPTEIRLTGKIESLPLQDQFTACPSFGEKPTQGNPLDFVLTVETIDKETREKLGNSTVAILQNGTPIAKLKTLNKGMVKTRIPLGITYFYAIHSDYFPAEGDFYVNFRSNHVILELEKKPVSPIQSEESEWLAEELLERKELQNETKEQEIKTFEEEPERVIIIEENEMSEMELSSIVEIEEVEEVEEDVISMALRELDRDNFEKTYFAPINITFVIDVSSSMKQFGRLELLKYALNQLTEMIRPQDKIGIVTFSNDARVLLKPTSGANKEEINEMVKSLKAYGLTAGEAGIKLGYKQAQKGKIKDGKNHLIIITDGGFNRNSENYKKFIEQNLRKRAITMSVVGIKSDSRAENDLKEASALGNGKFVLIEDLADAQEKLKQEIRLRAFR